MKYYLSFLKQVQVFVFILILSFNCIHAQKSDRNNFSFTIGSSFGNTLMKNEKNPNYNMNGYIVNALLNYELGEKYELTTGLMYSDINGNGVNSLGDFRHKREVLRIPLLTSISLYVSKQIYIKVDFGIYTQNIISDKYNFINTKQENIFFGWNFGAQSGISVVYQFYNNIGIGVNYIAQNDISKLKSNKKQLIFDRQKMESFNQFGLFFVFDL